jgi:hypothetical protein
MSSTARARRGRIRDGRVAAAPELAATRRPLRQAKRQPLIEDCDVRPGDLHACARPRPCLLEIDGSATVTTAVGLELGSEDGLDGTIGFDGNGSRHAGHPGDRFHSRDSASRAIAKATYQSRRAGARVSARSAFTRR